MPKIELCQNCGDPTGCCEDDSLSIDGHGTVCPDCYDGLTEDYNDERLTEEDITGLRKVLGDALADNEILNVGEKP